MWVGNYIFGNKPKLLSDNYSFKQRYPFDRRLNESKRLKERYPELIPVIVEKANNNDLPELEKEKYLLQKDLTIGQFMHSIRNKIKLQPEDAILLFVNNNVTPAISDSFKDIYENHKDKDGFLYFTLSKELTFGL